MVLFVIVDEGVTVCTNMIDVLNTMADLLAWSDCYIAWGLINDAHRPQNRFLINYMSSFLFKIEKNVIYKCSR